MSSRATTRFFGTLALGALGVLVWFLRADTQERPAWPSTASLDTTLQVSTLQKLSSSAPTTPHRRTAATSSVGASSDEPVLRGVVQAGGCAMIEGALVVAMRQANMPTESELRAGLDLGARLRFARADARGRFTIRGVAPAAEYLLTVAADGALAREPLWNVTTQSAEVTLVLDALYRSALRLTDRSGGPLLVGDEVRYSRGVRTSIAKSHGLTDVSARLLELSILARPAPERRRGERLFESWFLARAALERTTVGAADIHLPGYEPIRADLLAHRAIGATPDQQLSLWRDSTPLGSLVIRLEPASWTTKLDDRVRERLSNCSPGQLTLTNEQGASIEVEVSASAFEEGGHQLSLPVGHYECYFLAHRGSFRHPLDGAPHRFALSADAGAVELRILLTESAGVELRLRDRNGQSFEGPVVLRMSIPGARGWRHVELAAPPYTLDVLTSGQHEIAAMLPCEFEAPGAERWRGRFEVSAGDWRVLELLEQVEQ